MEKLQAGDTAALGLLFDRYSRLALSIGFRVLRDRCEAEELVQDVFVQIFEKARSFDAGKGEVRGWLVQIVYHRAFDRRAHLRRRRFYDGTNATDLTNTLRGQGNLEEQIQSRLGATRLREAFQELSAKQRATLEMFFFEGYTLREISRHFDEPIESIRHHYYRGLDRLRKTATAVALRK
jgi:RNA polymerase sigma-70 factor (ECF subfamily)